MIREHLGARAAPILLVLAVAGAAHAALPQEPPAGDAPAEAPPPAPAEAPPPAETLPPVSGDTLPPSPVESLPPPPPPPSPSRTAAPKDPPGAVATGTLRGLVVDATTGEPVPAAFVSAGGVTDLTGPDGRFTLTGLAMGPVELMVATELYAPAVLAVELTELSPAADVEITLTPDDSLQGEIVEITGEAPDPAEPPSYELTVDEIRALPGSGNDTLKSLQSLPGVARMPFGMGGLVLRGASPRDTNVYLDGVEVPLLYHFGGLASFYPSSLLTSLDMVPGGFSAEYGRAQGGVVLLRSRPGRTDRWRVESEVSLQDASLRADGPGPLGGAWTIALRRSYLDAVLALALPEDGAFSLTLAPRYYDGQLRYDLELGGGQRVSAMLFGSDDRLSFLFSDDDDEMDMGAPAEQSRFSYVQRFMRAALRWERRTADVTMSFTPWVGWDENSIRFDEEGITHEVVPVGARLNLLRSFDRGYLAGGLDVQGARHSSNINSEQPPMPGQPESDDLVLSTGTAWHADVGLWLEGLYGLWDGQVNVKPGLRLEHYGLTGEWVLDPRLNLAQPLRHGITLRQSVGIYHQPPVAANLDPLFGNPDLGSSYAVQTSAGVEVALPVGVEVSATGFFDQAYDVPVDVVSSATGAADPGNPLAGGGGAASRETTSEQFGTFTYQENLGRGRNYGVETMIRGAGGTPGQAGHWLGWLSYTYSRALRRYDPNYYPAYYPYVLDQPHVLTALGSVMLTDHWRLGARVRVVSGNPITPVTGSYYDAEILRYRALSGDVLSQRLPAFFQLDVRLDRTWRRSWGVVSLFLDVQNATNRLNAEGVTYNYDYTEQTYTRGLPIIPSIGVEYRP